MKKMILLLAAMLVSQITLADPIDQVQNPLPLIVGCKGGINGTVAVFSTSEAKIVFEYVQKIKGPIFTNYNDSDLSLAEAINLNKVCYVSLARSAAPLIDAGFTIVDINIDKRLQNRFIDTTLFVGSRDNIVGKTVRLKR